MATDSSGGRVLGVILNMCRNSGDMRAEIDDEQGAAKTFNFAEISNVPNSSAAEIARCRHPPSNNFRFPSILASLLQCLVWNF